MAKKGKSVESLHDLSAAELDVRLAEVQENHFRLRLRHAGNPLKNPMEIRQARREIARLKTVLREKVKEPA